MIGVEEITVSNLLFDEENPRLTYPVQDQRDILRAIASDQGVKLRVLAEDILTHGLSPSELMMVCGSETQDNRYVVLEGNRRLAALRVLENPDVVEGVVASTVLRALKQLHKRYQDTAVKKTLCVVMEDPDEARHWLAVKHMGERSGAGTVLWGSEESARFRAKTTGDHPEIHLQALDFLQERGDIDAELRQKVRSTTLQRLLRTPAVRLRLGLEWRDKQLKALGDIDEVATILLHVVQDISGKNISVKDVYTKAQRIEYANKLPANLIPAHIHSLEYGVPLNSGLATPGTRPKDPGTRPKDPETKPKDPETKPKDPEQASRPKAYLIPDTCALEVTDTRPREIEQELRKLRVETFPNAVSVLFRVFLELSVDCYIERHNLSTSEGQRLSAKLNAVTQHLVDCDKLSEQKARPARQAAQAKSFLGPSITVMHQYVHNPHMFPSPTDLRATWNNLEPWFMAVWPS